MDILNLGESHLNRGDLAMESEAERFEKAVKKVFNRLISMDTEEFRSELERHKNGDISRILLETDGLEWILPC